MRARGLAALCLLSLGCAHSPSEPRLVDLARIDPSIAVDMRYAGPDNFVGRPIDGYEAPRCLLTQPAARALSLVQRDLAPQGLGLRVFDCYRPQRAVDDFVRWASDPSDQRTRAAHYPHVEKSQLFEEGYIARRSSHSRGSTVDLTLVRRNGPAPVALDMGTPFDFFDPASHTDSPEVTPAQHRNRLLLRAAMERRDLENLPEEWWHYTLRDEPYPHTRWNVPVR